MYEHLLFLNFLVVPKLQPEIQSLMKAWMLEIETKSENIFVLLHKTRELKLYLLRNVELASYVLPPAKIEPLLTHMLEELDYYEGLLKRTLTEQEELKFLAKESAEHDEYILGSLKEKREEVTFVFTRLVEKLSEEAKSEYGPDGQLKFWLKSSNKAINNVLVECIESILPQAMMEHELSEGRWAVLRYNQLIEKF